MTFAEIYGAIYGGADEATKRRACHELAHMSNEDWCDWICYRNDRKRTALAH